MTALAVTKLNRVIPASIDGWLLLATSLFLFTLPLPHTISIRQVALFMALVLGAIVIARRGLPTLPLKVPFLVWLVVAVLSLIHAVRPGYSLHEIKTEIVYGFVTYLVFFSQAHGERQWNIWRYVLLASFLVLTVGSIVVWSETGHAVTTWTLYNGVGSYTSYWITIFPFLVYLFFNIPARATWRILLRIAPFLFLIPVFLTRNRTVWIAFGVSCVILFALGFFKLESTKYKKRLSYSLLILLTGIALAFFYMLANRLATGAELSIAQILQQDPRAEVWPSVVADLADRPWQGAGFGLLSFEHVYPQWREKYSFMVHAHNFLLDAGVQMGIPGVLAMVFLFFSIVREYWRLYRTQDRRLQWIGACGITMAIGVLVRNMTDNFFTRDLALLFWAMVGMSLGYAQRLQSAPGEAADKWRRPA